MNELRLLAIVLFLALFGGGFALLSWLTLPLYKKYLNQVPKNGLFDIGLGRPEKPKGTADSDGKRLLSNSERDQRNP